MKPRGCPSPRLIAAVLSVTVAALPLTAAAGNPPAPKTGAAAGTHERHDLAGAERLLRDAVEKIDAAQKANHDKLGGHAEKAKKFIKEARAELRLADPKIGANEPGARPRLTGATKLAGNGKAGDRPNLAEAEKLLHDATEKVSAGQLAGDDKLGDHAKKAKELIEEARAEIKLAAENAAPNENTRQPRRAVAGTVGRVRLAALR
jgi:hypothetical protein